MSSYGKKCGMIIIITIITKIPFALDQKSKNLAKAKEIKKNKKNPEEGNLRKKKLFSFWEKESNWAHECPMKLVRSSNVDFLFDKMM